MKYKAKEQTINNIDLLSQFLFWFHKQTNKKNNYYYNFFFVMFLIQTKKNCLNVI